MKQIVTIGFALLVTVPAVAGPREQAKRMHDRIAGVPPTESVLSQMEQLIAAGDLEGAAAIPLASEEFLRITLKNMFSTWTNVDGTMDLPLNDYTATAIGLVRDDASFDEILYGNVLYTARDGIAGIPAYSPANNDHYAALENQGGTYLLDLARRDQMALTGLGVAAGVMTTRTFGEAFYNAGTNRRPVAFTLNTFLCREMEQLNDVTRPDPYIRRDVDRAPGGDPLAFRNKCAGCHSGMDPLSKAFAHVDFDGTAVVYDANAIPEKINRNGDVFPGGFVTEDDTWLNLWTAGQNAVLGWNGMQTGTGPASYGRLLAESDAFPACMAERVFAKVCLRAPADEGELATIHELGAKFRADGFKMKALFTDLVQLCID